MLEETESKDNVWVVFSPNDAIFLYPTVAFLALEHREVDCATQYRDFSGWGPHPNPPTDPPVTSGKSQSGTQDHDHDVLAGPFMRAIT